MAEETRMVTTREDSQYPALFHLASKFFGSTEYIVNKLKGDASDRVIFRFRSLDDERHSIIGVTHSNTRENQDFLYLAENLRRFGFPVPAVQAISVDQSSYLLDDLGPETLADKLAQWQAASPSSASIIKAYQRVLIFMADMQRKIVPALPEFFNQRVMNKQVYLTDIEYYRNEFLTRFGLDTLESDSAKKEVNHVITKISALETVHFVYRDFQSRNIMWFDSAPWFIDFQSALKGPVYYDLASLLYSSKSYLTDSQREILLRYYFDLKPIDQSWDSFRSFFYAFVIIRRLRSLGSYGYLSMVKQKRDFLPRIYPTLVELTHLMESNESVTQFSQLLLALKEIRNRWEERYGAEESPSAI